MMSPGFPLNSYSRHIVCGVRTGSAVPSITTSNRSFVTEPNAPYVPTMWKGSKLAFMICRRESRLRAGR